jgi:hypothetical protein
VSSLLGCSSSTGGRSVAGEGLQGVSSLAALTSLTAGRRRRAPVSGEGTTDTPAHGLLRTASFTSLPSRAAISLRSRLSRQGGEGAHR